MTGKNLLLVATICLLQACSGSRYYFHKRLGHGTDFTENQVGLAKSQNTDNMPVVSSNNKRTDCALYDTKTCPPLPAPAALSQVPDTHHIKRVEEDAEGNFREIDYTQKQEHYEHSQGVFWSSVALVSAGGFGAALVAGVALGTALLWIMGVFILIIMLSSEIRTR